MRSPLTDKEIERAYGTWARSYRHADLDRAIYPFQHLKLCERKWLRQARKALGLTADAVAARLFVSRASVYQLERREPSGQISIHNLQKLAEAMDCDLVYALRPKRGRSFSRVIWERTYPKFLSHPLIGKGDPNNRGGMLSYLVRKHLAKRRRLDPSECAGILSFDR